MTSLPVHYLDIVRHFIAFAAQPFNWISNITASVVTFAALSLFWPPARRAYKGWFEGHIGSIHDKLDAQHAEHMDTINAQHAEHMKAIKAATPAKAPVKKAATK